MSIQENFDASFAFLAEHSLDIICRADLKRVFRYVSPSSIRVLGWTPEEMTGKSAEAFIHSEDKPLLSRAVASEQHTVIFRMLKKDGSFAWMENHANMVRDPDSGHPAQWVVLMRDITERKLLEQKLERLARTDGLTGLANRRAFDESIAYEWHRTLREGSQISLLLLDIDHFKSFNDHFGHQVGDDCLRAVAVAVSGAVRASDFVARYGGEEMVVILPATDQAGALAAAEKVRQAVEALAITHSCSGKGCAVVTVSVGAATALARLGGSINMPESLLQAADNALYRSKHEGRNRISSTLLIAPRAE